MLQEDEMHLYFVVNDIINISRNGSMYDLIDILEYHYPDVYDELLDTIHMLEGSYEKNRW